ncbi:MAG: serine/threonine protein kinase [Candidatus Obscuribacterales bacterium]|nr:serine/threonine protein kinase [Candidatus Obscuribacterales bacterium]
MVNSPQKAKSTKEAKRLSADLARIGTVLSERYELQKLLGHGGMGAVYKARHLLMDRTVAIKMLLPEMAEDDSMRERFLREAKTAGKVNHPNIVQLIDYGEGPEGEAYIVIEFLDGIGLDQLIREQGPLPEARAINIFAQICDGVSKAHRKGVLHRDLKPSNIMLVREDGEDDFVKIVDFGLAKVLDPNEESQRLTQSGEIFGSPIYMSPEQCLGQQLDSRSDIYALGVLMYETLTGKVPILGANVTETIARQMQEIPKAFSEIRPDLEISAALEKVVMKALSKSMDERQESMLELREELIDAGLPKLKARPRKHTSSTDFVAADLKKEFSRIENARKAAQEKDGNLRNIANTRAALPGKGNSFSTRSLLFSLAAIAGVGGLLAVFSFFLLRHQSPETNSLPSALNSQNRFMQNQAKSSFPEEKLPKNIELEKVTAPPQISSKRNPALKAAQTRPERAKFKKNPQADCSRNAETQSSRSKNKTIKSVTDTAAADCVETTSPRHHRDWHDFSSRYEKKDDFSHSWSVPMAGSRTE